MWTSERWTAEQANVGLMPVRSGVQVWRAGAVSRGRRRDALQSQRVQPSRVVGRVTLVVLAALGLLACGTPPTALDPAPSTAAGELGEQKRTVSGAAQNVAVEADSTVVPPAPGDSVPPGGGWRISW